MDVIQTSNKVADMFGPGLHGFGPGNPTTGVLATYFSYLWANGVQQELINLIKASGQAPDGANLAQVLLAIRSGALIYGTDTGGPNAAVVAFTPAIPALVDGMVLWFKAAAANTGATTLNVNGIGAKAVVGGAHTALQGGEIVANGKCMVVYSTTLDKFVLIECTGAALQVAPATQSQHAMQFGQALGRLVNIQVLSASGTYIRSPGATQGIVELWGGATGGSGSVATSASQVSMGRGGGSGAYGKHYYSSLPATQAYTIGAGGAGGTAGGGGGGAGGDTIFGGLTAPGAPATAAALAYTPPAVESGGLGAAVATGCNLVNSAGASAPPSHGLTTSSIIGGAGAPSTLGGGANPRISSSAAGIASSTRGAGGGSGSNGASTAGQIGGAGGNGLIVVHEYA